MEVVRRQLRGLETVPGMRPTSEGVSLLLEILLESSSSLNTLDVLVTHDSVIAAFVGHLLQIAPSDAMWPAFIDGPLVWRSSGGVGLAWMGRVQEVRSQDPSHSDGLV